MVILGTQYAGEMKKGIFTVMHYLMPKRGILSLHSGCNVGKNDDVTLFFGLSGEAAGQLAVQGRRATGPPAATLPCPGAPAATLTIWLRSVSGCQ